MRYSVILSLIAFVQCTTLQKKEEVVLPTVPVSMPTSKVEDTQIIVDKIEALIGEPDPNRALGTSEKHPKSSQEKREEKSFDFVTYSIKRVKDNLLLEVKFSIAIYRGKESYKATIKSDSYITRSNNPLIEEVEIRSSDKKEFLKKLQISLQKMN